MTKSSLRSHLEPSDPAPTKKRIVPLRIEPAQSMPRGVQRVLASDVLSVSALRCAWLNGAPQGRHSVAPTGEPGESAAY